MKKPTDQEFMQIGSIDINAKVERMANGIMVFEPNLGVVADLPFSFSFNQQSTHCLRHCWSLLRLKGLWHLMQ